MARLGKVWCVRAWQAGHGLHGLGVARLGWLRFGRHGKPRRFESRHVGVWQVEAWLARWDAASFVESGQGRLRQVLAGKENKKQEV